MQKATNTEKNTDRTKTVIFYIDLPENLSVMQSKYVNARVYQKEVKVRSIVLVLVPSILGGGRFS